MFAAVIWISRFKHQVLWMTANFMDLMIIDAETVAFLWTILPEVRIIGFVTAVVAVPVLVLLWRVDPLACPAARSRRRALPDVLPRWSPSRSLFPLAEGEVFADDNNISIFMRSGVEAVHILATQGYLESDAEVTERLKLTGEETCRPAGKRPHIILLHDESSFDIRAVNGVKVPPGYGAHFQSFDGKARTLLVEGAGGPSWYTEYNVLVGAFVALVRPFPVLRDADRRRPGVARPAACAAPLRLSHVFDLSGVRRVPRYANRTTKAPVSRISSTVRTSGAVCSSRTASISTTPHA